MVKFSNAFAIENNGTAPWKANGQSYIFQLFVLLQQLRFNRIATIHAIDIAERPLSRSN